MRKNNKSIVKLMDDELKEYYSRSDDDYCWSADYYYDNCHFYESYIKDINRIRQIKLNKILYDFSDNMRIKDFLSS